MNVTVVLKAEGNETEDMINEMFEKYGKVKWFRNTKLDEYDAVMVSIESPFYKVLQMKWEQGCVSLKGHPEILFPVKEFKGFDRITSMFKGYSTKVLH